MIPEFEIIDGLGKTRYLDHAVVRYPMLLDFEVDGYGTHQKDASRWSFADDRRRDAGLRMIGWDVLRIAFSDVKDHPLACQQLLKRWMAKYEPVSQEREWTEHVIRLGMYHATFTLGDVKRVLQISDHPARELLKEMAHTGNIIPCGIGKKRVHSYKLSEEFRLRNRPSKLNFRD